MIDRKAYERTCPNPLCRVRTFDAGANRDSLEPCPACAPADDVRGGHMNKDVEHPAETNAETVRPPGWRPSPPCPMEYCHEHHTPVTCEKVRELEAGLARERRRADAEERMKTRAWAALEEAAGGVVDGITWQARAEAMGADNKRLREAARLAEEEFREHLGRHGCDCGAHHFPATMTLRAALRPQAPGKKEETR